MVRSWHRNVHHGRDPAQADANLYRFCGDNPVNYVDPSGLKMSWSANELAAGGLERGDGHGPILPVQINNARRNDLGNAHATARRHVYSHAAEQFGP